MPFTDDERRRWHEQKRAREHRRTPVYQSELIAICVHCQRSFGINEGMVTEEVALCDICNGD